MLVQLASANLEDADASPNEIDPVDRAGKTLFRELRLKTAVCEQNFQRAVISAHQASMQTRALENRIEELETECVVVRERAERGEWWLQHLAGEIDRAFLPAERSTLPRHKSSTGEL
jgi:hypothetical protein